MNEVKRPADFSAIGGTDAAGLFFTYHFDANGLKCEDGAQAAWTWRSYLLTDMHARQALANDPDLPVEAKQAFLSGGSDCHVDLDDGWLHGDLPDLRHDYSAEARGLGPLRFAFNVRQLIGARKQPLDSVERVRKQIEARTRPFRSPAQLIEAVMMQSLDGMSVELSALGETLDGIEDRIVCDAWHNERQALVDARRKLVIIHRQMAALTGLFRHLDHAHRHDLPEAFVDMTARLSHRSHALHHDGEQLQARARLLQDELMAKLGAQSNRLLYILSVMTAVLLPMTIISGLFGMNVGGLPFTQTGAGFWVVSIISLAVAGTTLYFVKRLGDGM
jgi:zinc transporter